MVVNKRPGDLVQPDPSGAPALENEIKAFIKQRDGKPGEVFLGVVHRIDRPVSGAVIFAKTSKALVRLNQMVKDRAIKKTYWAVTDRPPPQQEALLVHHVVRNPGKNTSKAFDAPTKNSKEARLRYRLACSSDRFHLLDIELITGRHHQIRCQLAMIGCHIKGDLKYGAARSNPDGGICLHSRRVEFVHPVCPPGETPRQINITAPAPKDNLWRFFEENAGR